MRKFLINPLIILFLLSSFTITFASSSFAYDDYTPTEEKVEPEKGCPVTNFTDNNKCTNCHQMVWNRTGNPTFGLKEIQPDSNYNVPFFDLKPVWDGEKFVSHIRINDIDADRFRRSLDYIRWHPELGKLIVLDIYSGGGGLFEAWSIISHMREFEKYGYIFETRVQGFAASAAFLIFTGGTMGHRFAHSQAELMWHEIWSFKFLAVETPSKKEHEAEIFRHLMDTIHNWLATRGNITKEDLDNKVQFKEYWINGKQLFELGFADGLIDG